VSKAFDFLSIGVANEWVLSANKLAGSSSFVVVSVEKPEHKPAVKVDDRGNVLDVCSPREVVDHCLNALYYFGPMNASQLVSKLMMRQIDCPAETVTRLMEEQIAALPAYSKPFAIAEGFEFRTYKSFSRAF
jgi:hypothetical protein